MTRLFWLRHKSINSSYKISWKW